MSLPYRDADQIAEAQEAVRNNIPLDRIAGHLRVSVDEARRLLDLPSIRPIPETTSDDFDLFSCDRLDGVL